MSPQLIGIVGKIGVGKSTAANYLEEKLQFKEVSFAFPLKKIAIELGFKENEVFGTQEEKLEKNELWNISGREFLQKFGTDICRNTLPEMFPSMSGIWIKLGRQKIEELMKTNYNVVISDVRFPDEAEMIRELGGKIVRIERDTGETKCEVNTHASELQSSQIKADVVVQNVEGMPDLLYDKFDDIIGVKLLDDFEVDDLEVDDNITGSSGVNPWLMVGLGLGCFALQVLSLRVGFMY